MCNAVLGNDLKLPSYAGYKTIKKDKNKRPRVIHAEVSKKDVFLP